MQINKNETKNKKQTKQKWDKLRWGKTLFKSDSDGLKQSGVCVGDFKLSIWEFLKNWMN